MKTLTQIENLLNRHLAWFMTNGNKMHRLEQYRPKRVKDYKTRNEQVRWLHSVANSARTREQIKAAERLAELFAIHHGEKFSPSTGRILDDNYELLNNPR